MANARNIYEIPHGNEFLILDRLGQLGCPHARLLHLNSSANSPYVIMCGGTYLRCLGHAPIEPRRAQPASSLGVQPECPAEINPNLILGVIHSH